MTTSNQLLLFGVGAADVIDCHSPTTTITKGAPNEDRRPTNLQRVRRQSVPPPRQPGARESRNVYRVRSRDHCRRTLRPRCERERKGNRGKHSPALAVVGEARRQTLQSALRHRWSLALLPRSSAGLRSFRFPLSGVVLAIAQYGLFRAGYAGWLAGGASLCGRSEGWGQQLETGNPTLYRTLNGLTPVGRRIPLFQPLVHSLDGNVASSR